MDITGFEETQKAERRSVPNGPTGPNVFTVPLNAYAFQPWSNRHPNLSQWFNYGLTPISWQDYATSQIRMATNSQSTVLPLSAGTLHDTGLSGPSHGPSSGNGQTRG